MNLSGLVVGPDFRFGQNRAGDTKVLAELAEKTQVILLLPGSVCLSWSESFKHTYSPIIIARRC